MVLNASLWVEQLFLIASGDETQFNQTTRHRSGPKYQETSLMNSFIGTIGLCTDLLLNHFSQFHALRHILILNELEHDITLRRIGIKTLINLFIVLLHENYGVLTLCHGQIVSCSVHTQSINLKTTCNPSFRQCIGMHADEEIGLCLIGNIGPFVKRNKDIGFSCIDNLHVRTVTLHHSSKGQCNLQVNVLLFWYSANGSCIMATMSGIDNKGETMISCFGWKNQSQHHCYDENPSISHYRMQI